MTEHPTPRTYAGRPPATGRALGSSPFLIRLAHPQALLAHVSAFLTVTTALALVNIMLDPGAVWSRAVMVVWLVLLAAHGVGIMILRLLTDDGGGAPSWRAPATAPSESAGGWPPGPAAGGAAPEATSGDTATVSDWGPLSPAESGAGDLGWPAAPHEETTAQPVAVPSARNGDDTVPWRAATEIAWLRKRRTAGTTMDRGAGMTTTETRERDA